MGAISFVQVHRTILWQHEDIRGRLRVLTRTAGSAVSPRALETLRLLLVHFAVRFDAHLAYEERELAPRVRDLDAWGPAREERLLTEHVEQRRSLARVCALADGAGEASFAEIAAEVIELVEGLALDMTNEEKWLCELEDVEKHGHTQMTG
jgi:hypothetical protein